MNHQEQTLIDELFGKLRTAEASGGSRDAAVEAHIKEHLRRQPAAGYYMAQAILVQEAAVNQLNRQLAERDEQIRQLQAKVQQAPASGGGFLSGLFGGQAAREQPPQPAAGGWRDSAPAAPSPAVPAAAPKGSGFLGSALQTAAGVAGGVMLAQGISSLFGHHNAPQEIVEVIHDAPAQAYQADDWENRNQDYPGNDDGDLFDDDGFV